MQQKTQGLAARAARIMAGGFVLATLPFAPVHANPPTPEPVPRLEVAQAGDERLDCTGISREIAQMENVIYEYNAAQRSAENTGTGISIAKAVGGFLIGSVPGALGVLAAGHVASEAAEGRAQDAQELENIAAQRRSMMIGMYNAKECKGPIHSMRAVRAAALDTPVVNTPAVAMIEPAAGDAKRITERRDYSGSAMNVRYND